MGRSKDAHIAPGPSRAAAALSSPAMAAEDTVSERTLRTTVRYGRRQGLSSCASSLGERDRIFAEFVATSAKAEQARCINGAARGWLHSARPQKTPAEAG
jgi:hypothetical protein